MDTILRIENLHKSFKTGFIPKAKKILNGISLEVHGGEIFGYLGPNGAGKTTTLKCVLGLIFPDEGHIEIFGQSNLSVRAKERIGFLPENPYFYDHLKAEEFLSFYSDLTMMKKENKPAKIQSLLKMVGLEHAAGLQLRKYSRGMLQRIGLAQALVNDPSLVLLDEPLGGLDPLGRKEIRDVIVRLREEGKTVFLSSHILQDIEMICDKVAILVDGRIISQGFLQDLISEQVKVTEITVSGIQTEDFEDLGERYSVQGGRILLKVFKEEKIADVLQLVQTKKGKIHSLIPRTETLEDIFLGAIRQK
jgi:ABC-2 type transport system ATP-binding protein